MSRVTPDEEYAAGIVSSASHAPLASRQKSPHCHARESIQRTSTTLSGGQEALEVSVCAVSDAGRTASRTKTATRDISRAFENGNESYRSIKTASKHCGVTATPAVQH